MAATIGGSGSQPKIGASEIESTEAISSASTDAASGAVVEGSTGRTAARTARPRSLDMGSFDLAGQLAARLDGAGTAKATETSKAAETAAPKGAVPTPAFDAALAAAKAGGLNGKEAKALMKIAEKTIRDADDPAATFQALYQKIEPLYEEKITPEAEEALDGFETTAYTAVLETHLSHAKAAGKKLGDALKAGGPAMQKPPLSEVDPKSLKGAVNEETGYVHLKLKNGTEVQAGSPHALALAALIKGDPKLATVTVGQPKIH